MPVRKVISGGQIGADVAGLRAAKRCGIRTGGRMPKGFLTLRGPQPHMKEVFHVEEDTSALYPPRTYWNVKNSDGTVRFAEDFGTRGERCTLKALTKFKRPYIDIQIRNDEWWPARIVAWPPPSELTDWLKRYNIEVLNIAGNARSDLEKFIEQYLEEVFLRDGAYGK